ncbi:MAG: ribonuclease P protein component [Candidatus Dasytiphilus stammeri]
MNFSFSDNLRLLTKKNFSKVIKKQHKICMSSMILFYSGNSIDHPRIGIAISKKNVKLAHERNRIKRLIRESFRYHKNDLYAMDFVLMITNEINCMDNSAIMTVLGILWSHHLIKCTQDY